MSATVHNQSACEVRAADQLSLAGSWMIWRLRVAEQREARASSAGSKRAIQLSEWLIAITGRDQPRIKPSMGSRVRRQQAARSQPRGREKARVGAAVGAVHARLRTPCSVAGFCLDACTHAPCSVPLRWQVRPLSTCGGVSIRRVHPQSGAASICIYARPSAIGRL